MGDKLLCSYFQKSILESQIKSNNLHSLFSGQKLKSRRYLSTKYDSFLSPMLVIRGAPSDSNFDDKLGRPMIAQRKSAEGSNQF